MTDGGGEALIRRLLDSGRLEHVTTSPDLAEAIVAVAATRCGIPTPPAPG